MKSQKQILILVNKQDEELGFKDKEEVHKGQGSMHRAFIVFFVNNKKQLLLTKRSKNKLLWPNFWDASVISHVLKGESYKQAAVRRAEEELNIKIGQKDLKICGGFSYRSEYLNIGSENEYCQVLITKYSKEVKPNPEEISDSRFVDKKTITRELSVKNDQFTPWFKIGFRLYLGSL